MSKNNVLKAKIAKVVDQKSNLYEGLKFIDKILGEDYAECINDIKKVIRENKDNGLSCYNYLYECDCGSKYSEIQEYMDYVDESELFLDESDWDSGANYDKYDEPIVDTPKHLPYGDKMPSIFEDYEEDPFPSHFMTRHKGTGKLQYADTSKVERNKLKEIIESLNEEDYEVKGFMAESDMHNYVKENNYARYNFKPVDDSERKAEVMQKMNQEGNKGIFYSMYDLLKGVVNRIKTMDAKPDMDQINNILSRERDPDLKMSLGTPKDFNIDLSTGDTYSFNVYMKEKGGRVKYYITEKKKNKKLDEVVKRKNSTDYYNSLSSLFSYVNDLIKSEGFEFHDEDGLFKFGAGGIPYGTTKSNNFIIRAIGGNKGKYFYLSVYRMPSGKYEYTGYFNSKLMPLDKMIALHNK
jgi:hypothetical protein